MGYYSNFLSETHGMVRATAQKFAEKEIRPFANDWEEAGEFPRELYAKAGKAGILGVGFPEELGGSGGGAMESVMMIEGMMRGGSTGVSVGLGSLGIALPPVVSMGTDDQKHRFVKPTVAGDTIAALAITEPGTGSDVAGVRTSAVLNGDHYVVNGAKMFITSGTRADFLTTLCRTSKEPHGGLTFLMIERETPGVTVSRSLKKTGWWASDTAELAFENVNVPVANRIGDEGSGFIALMRNFQSERLALAAYGVVTAEICLEESLKYVTEREAFGRPIAGFQVTRHRLADMATQVMAAKTMVYQVATRMDVGESVMTEVSMAKNFAAELAVDISYQAVQLHGGMGYMREVLVERLSRDARLLPIGGGTQEIMKEIIAKGMGL